MSAKTLRDKLTDLFFKAAGGISDMAKDEVDEAMQLIKADRQAAVREARIQGKLDFIDENYPNLMSDSPEQNYTQINWVVREVRAYLLAELQSHQPTNKEEE